MATTASERVRQAREKLGMTLPAFAEFIGKSRRSVIEYESGRTTVPASVLMLIEMKLKERKEQRA